MVDLEQICYWQKVNQSKSTPHNSAIILDISSSSAYFCFCFWVFTFAFISTVFCSTFCLLSFFSCPSISASMSYNKKYLTSTSSKRSLSSAMSFSLSFSCSCTIFCSWVWKMISSSLSFTLSWSFRCSWALYNELTVFLSIMAFYSWNFLF